MAVVIICSDFGAQENKICHYFHFLYIWNFLVHILLKPSLENFEHYFTSVWDEYNCVVVWTFFGIAFLWNWNENWPFPVLWPLLSFQICLRMECSTFTASSFRIWSSSTGILSPPPALFIVMLLKAHLTSHSRMSGSGWVITPLWLSGPINTWQIVGETMETVKDYFCELQNHCRWWLQPWN